MLGSKRSRLFCSLALFLAFWVPCLSVGANAAPENLINPDLRTWAQYCVSSLDTFRVTKCEHFVNNPYDPGFDIYQIWVNGEQLNESSAVYVVSALLNDSVDLVAGRSYTFEFYLPDYDDMNGSISGPNATGKSTYYGSDNSRLKLSFRPSSGFDIQMFIGIMFGTPDDDDFQGILATDIAYVEINYDNFDTYAGRTNKISFVCPDYKSTPSLCIGIVGTRNKYQSQFYFSNFALYNNDQTAAELKGIKGLLHSLYWDLFGGVCDEEDCPHSSEDNPHEDLLTRLFVPDEESVTSWKDKLDKLLADHLGIIYDAVDFMVELIVTVRDVLINPTGDITFPGIEFDLPGGQHVHLWDDIVVDFTFLESGFFKIFYNMYKLILNVICIFELIKYALSLWDKTMSN